MPDDPVFRIELRLDGAMPDGTAVGPDGAVRAFTGWIGLISAVDALARADDEPGPGVVAAPQ